MSELDYKTIWVLKNWCFWTVVFEKTLESPLDCKEIQAVHPIGDQSWVFLGRTDVEAETLNTLATWCKELTHWRRPWCWGRLKVGEGDDRGWDGWMASPTWWTWVWASSRIWWWTGSPGMLQSMGSQRVRLDWVTKLNWRPLSPSSPVLSILHFTDELYGFLWLLNLILPQLHAHTHFHSSLWHWWYPDSPTALGWGSLPMKECVS